MLALNEYSSNEITLIMFWQYVDMYKELNLLCMMQKDSLVCYSVNLYVTEKITDQFIQNVVDFSLLNFV